jgi:hypothetical protein
MAARHILSRRKRGRRHGHRSSGCSSWISSNPQNRRTTVICTWYVNRQENGVIALTVAQKPFLPPGGSECKRCAVSLSSQCDECTHISHSFRRVEVNANDAARKGPSEVTQRVTANTYRKRDVGSQRESRVDIRLLVPYHIHPLFATPLSVSEREQGEWVVESMVDHEPHVIPRDERHLRFRVRFRELSDTHDRM